MANYYVTTTGAGSQTGADWANAFDISDFETHIEATVVAGDRYFVAGGTYTCNSTIYTTRTGGTAAYIHIIGVKSTTTAEPPTGADYAIGTERPLFDFSGSATTYFEVAAYYIVMNIQVTGQRSNTSYGLFRTGNYCHVHNCYFSNNYNNTGVRALYIGADTRLFDCECEATYGRGLVSVSDAFIMNCYFHDCGLYNVYLGGDTTFIGNVVANSALGVWTFSNDQIDIIGNTIYNCTTGLEADAGSLRVFYLNNTISNCTDGFKGAFSGVIQDSHYFDYNNWYNNTRDMSWDDGSTEDNSAKGENATANNPGFIDGTGGNFTLSSTSELINAGFSMRLGIG